MNITGLVCNRGRVLAAIAACSVLVPAGSILGPLGPTPADAAVAPIYTLPFYVPASIPPEGCFHCYYDETYGWHEGTDYEVGAHDAGGEVIAAAASGTAIPCGPTDSAGNYVVADHGNGHRTRYLHFNSQLLSGSTAVGRGQAIGYEGNLGFTVPDDFYHLHFETRIDAQGAATCGKDGTAVDPYAGQFSPNTWMWEDNPPNHADVGPAITAFTSYDEFVRGRNDKVYQRHNGGGWPLVRSDGCLRSGPGAAEWSSTTLVVMVRDCTNHLSVTRKSGGSWTSWATVAGVACTLGAPALAVPTANTIQAFYRGCNNVLYKTTSTNGGQNWSGNVGISGTCLLSAPAAVAYTSTRTDVVYRGCDNAIWHNWNSGSTWLAEGLGGCTMVAPGIASYAAGKLDVFHRGCGPAGSAEGLFQRSYNGSWAANWVNHAGSCAASGIGADSIAPDVLDAVYRGCSSPTVFKAYWTGTGSWTHIPIGSWP